MNNTAAIIKIVCWAIVALLLIGLLWCLLTANTFSSLFSFLRNGKTINFHSGIIPSITGELNGEYSETGSYSAEASGIRNLNVDWVDGCVKISVYDGSDISFTESSSMTLSSDKSLRFGVSGSTLNIKYCDDYSSFIVDSPDKDLELLIPASIASDLDKLSINSASAELDIEGLSAEDVKVNTVSGSLSMSSVVAESIDVNTTSGRVMLTDGSADSLDITGISAEVTVNGAYVDFDAETVSGKINLILTESASDIDVETVSGHVTLALPESAQFTVSLGSISGDFSSDFETAVNDGEYIHGDGRMQIDVDSVSGGLRLVKSN